MRTWDKSKPPNGPWFFNKDSIQAQALSFWWPGGGASGGLAIAEHASGQNVFATRGSALNAYSLTNDGLPSLQYNGTNNGDSSVITLPSNSITLAFRMLVTAYADADKLAFEYTPNYNSNNGFIINPDSSATSFDVALKDLGGGIRGATYARPSAGVWHDYLITLDRTGVGLSGVSAYFDGLLQTPLTAFTATLVFSFDNSTLYWMSRAGTALLAAGQLADVRVYNGVSNAAALAQAYSDPGTKYELWRPLRSTKWIAGAAVTGNPWHYYAQMRRQGA